MTTVPPPSTPQPQITVAPSQPAVVQILNPPPAVVALPPGTVLEAVVKPPPPAAMPIPDNSKQQTVTLATPQGDVAVKLPAQLPESAKVALEVLRTAQANQQTPQVTVRLVTIDNQPAAQVLAQLARQAPADPRLAQQPPPTQLLQIPANDPQNPLLRAAVIPPGNAWTVNGPVQVPSLGTVSALVVLGAPVAATPEQAITALNTPQNAPPIAVANAAALAAGVPSNLPTTAAPVAPSLTLVTGGEVSVRVTSITLPGAQPITASPVAPPPAPPIAPPAAPSAPLPITTVPAASPPTTPQVTLPIAPPTGGPIITNAQGLPAAPPTPPQTVQPPPVLATFTGTVVSQTPTGMPVIDTGAGQMQINVRANLPIGTHVTLEVSAQLEPRPGPLPPPPLPVTALPLSGPPGAIVGWPTLTESLQVLQRSDPQAAQILSQAIPDGGPKTAAAMISFAQAMRTGDARQWPGDNALRALERAGPRGAHLASQLSEEVGALSSRARETGTEWRALPLPWNAEGQIDRIALITRREGDADDDAKKKPGGGGQRFLINLDLSRLGAMQLDGMFRKESRGFDLMIRTKTELPDQIRNDLTGIFTASNAAMGLKGGLTFQVVKKFTDPTAGALSADKGGLWA
jgi:hypothetical protein